MPSKEIIKVYSKVTTNHPKYGGLREGEPKFIEARHFTDVLFSREPIKTIKYTKPIKRRK